MTDQYEELLRHLRMLARGKHDDVSIAADAAGAIIALLAERDAMHVELEKTRSAAIRGMDAATAVSYANLETAARLRAESSPEVLDSERAANAALTEEVETLRAERDALEKKLSAARNRKPDGHCYRYPCPLGNGTVIRHNNGREVNGSDPIEVIPYWYGEPPTAPSPSYDALLIISQSVAAALERAGVEECDDPGEAIDALAKDAARYRYIRDKRTVSFGASMDGCLFFAVNDCSLPRAPTFDAAIDAAMAGRKE